MIDSTLAAFLEEGLGIHLGTRNARLEPNGARIIAVKVDDRTQCLSLYVPETAASRVMPDLQTNGLAAVAFARPIDDRACQVKGTFLDVRPARSDERPFVAAQWDRFLSNLERIGVARAGTANWVTWPDVVITLQATEVFNQTPGVGAHVPIA